MPEMRSRESSWEDAPAAGDGLARPGAVRVVRFFVAILSTRSGGRPPATRLQRLPGGCTTHLVSADGRAELAFVEAEGTPRPSPPPADGSLTLLVGDDAEWRE